MIECGFKSPQLIKVISDISDIEAVSMTNIGIFIAFSIDCWSMVSKFSSITFIRYF
jgi:hypothetical protein